MGPSTHTTYLAQSDDLINWDTIPNYTPYQGSVPDVITRGDYLYIYNPGKVKIFNKSNSNWTTQNVSIVDSLNNPIPFVDPSAIIDSAGNLVLFFLNSTGIIGDPAQCNPYPCTKYFDSAKEIAGSNGTQFQKQSGTRYQITLNSGTASDPDIFTDGNQYYLYISYGNRTGVYQSSLLNGAYTPISGLPNNSELTTQGGIPSGIYDFDNNTYHTYVHSNVSGSTQIRHQQHNNFTTQLNNMNTLVNYTTFGGATNATAESPGICLNTFLTTAINTPIPQSFNLYPNPTQDILTVHLTQFPLKPIPLQILDITGKTIISENILTRTHTFNTSNLDKGIYFVKIANTVQKFIKQ